MSSSDASLLTRIIETVVDYRFLLEELRAIGIQSDMSGAHEKILMAAGKWLYAETVHLLVMDSNKSGLQYELSYHDHKISKGDFPEILPLTSKSIAAQGKITIP